jgi:hypothetical protein
VSILWLSDSARGFSLLELQDVSIELVAKLVAVFDSDTHGYNSHAFRHHLYGHHHTEEPAS